MHSRKAEVALAEAVTAPGVLGPSGSPCGSSKSVFAAALGCADGSALPCAVAVI